MDYRTRSPLRILAPLALVVFGLLFLLIVFSSGSSDEGSDAGSAQEQRLEVGGAADTGDKEPTKKSYKVETGDTLESIAKKTGVDVAELQRLNPDLDPQALTTGQKIKLQE